MVEARGPVGQPFHAPKMAEIIAASLRRQIVRGELREGDALPSEAALMEQFGVSRPTLREAVRVLESESLISVRRGAHGGARVHSPDGAIAARYAALVLEYRGTQLGDIFRARTEVEGAAARLAAMNRRDSDIEALRGLHQEILGMTDVSIGIGLNERFAALVVEASGSESLIVISQILRAILDKATTEAVISSAHQPFAVQAFADSKLAHARLIELIEAGSAGKAEAHWRRHLVMAEEFVMSTGVSSKSVLDLL